jgi:hypothetical protein
MLMHKMVLEPFLSSKRPRNGEETAARIPPNDTAEETAVKDQPNSDAIGEIKIERVATAGPCLAKPAQQTQKRIIHP